MEEHKLNHLSNEELLKLYQQGDALAFNEFYQRNKNLVFHFLLSKLRDRSEADDAFQKTFFKIHRHILKYDPKQSALGWVMTIAKHAAFDVKKRRKSKIQNLDEVAPSEIATDSQAMLEARSSLVAIVATLNSTERRLLESRFFYEESFEAIGNQEGWTPENTRQKVSRLIRRLKARILEPPL